MIRMINTITIKPGVGKNGTREEYNDIVLNSDTTVSIVGPTGSGKTALINDIELLARGDTNTKRCILVNGSEIEESLRSNVKLRPCVLITQNTKCFSDLIVRDFLDIHAKSRCNSIEGIVEKCITMANKFTGEKIDASMNVTTLSGGQTRALLIADALMISDAPVLILDEIENAGIYKNKVLEEVKKHNKMVIFVTHDPTIALKTNIRLVMKEGKITQVIHRNDMEIDFSKMLNKVDIFLDEVKEKIRHGEALDESYDKLKYILSKKENI